MAMTTDRKTPRRDGVELVFPVAAGATIHAGGIVVLNAGKAEMASEATGLVAVGVAQQAEDNTGGVDGAKTVLVRAGVFAFDNSAAADEVTLADVGSDVYLVDGQTVAKTSATDTRSIAGKCVHVDAAGVWVKVGV